MYRANRGFAADPGERYKIRRYWLKLATRLTPPNLVEQSRPEVAIIALEPIQDIGARIGLTQGIGFAGRQVMGYRSLQCARLGIGQGFIHDVNM